MIIVTRFNGTRLYLNADLIQTVEGTPDTVITLTNNTKVVVKESTDVIFNRIVTYKRLINNPQLPIPTGE